MKQALLYLMKYLTSIMGCSGTLIIASLLRENSAGIDVIRITITGKGSRASQEELDKLFDPITIVPDADIDLGPCASQKIIEDHGGHIEVKSEQVDGISFMIDLPSEQN
jgi:nitrogen fixation/metabolism regulation signal transduction histidine kinase